MLFPQAESASCLCAQLVSEPSLFASGPWSLLLHFLFVRFPGVVGASEGLRGAWLPAGWASTVAGMQPKRSI